MKDSRLYFPPMEFFQLEGVIVKNLFDHNKEVWFALDQFDRFFQTLSFSTNIETFSHVHILRPECIFIAESATISRGVTIEGPAYIGPGCTIRPNAYIREKTILCENVLLGHSCEIVRSIVLNDAKIPHLNYVGDSILGKGVNIGAGVKIANQKLKKDVISIKAENARVSTNRKKLGAIIGDSCMVGCNSVLNPGTILYPNTMIKPLTSVQGVFPCYSKRFLHSQIDLFKATANENKEM